MMYNKRTWLNNEGSPSTGNVIGYDGDTSWKGESVRNTFLQISDCNNSVRLHRVEDDTIDDFIEKMELLNSEIGEFITYLKQTI